MKYPVVSGWLKSFALSSCLSLLCAPIALAQSAELTRAEVYRLQNIVDLLLQNQSPRPAKVEDVLAPRDAMETGSRSRAELIFNEGSLARIGSDSVFRFVPGTRRYQLPNGGARAETVFQLQRGVAMVISSPGGESVADGGRDDFGFDGGDDGGGSVLLSSTAQVPGAQVRMLPHSVLLMVVKPTGSLFIALTDGLRISDLSGNGALLLQAGQTVTVKDGVFGPVENFDLRQLYRTSALTFGLGPDMDAAQTVQLEQEPENVRAALRQARQNTLRAIAAQDATLQGLCTLDARGGDSTLSSNCVTTGADDPLSEFEDQREDVGPGADEVPPGGDDDFEPNGQGQSPDQEPLQQIPTQIPLEQAPVNQGVEGQGVEGQGQDNNQDGQGLI